MTKPSQLFPPILLNNFQRITFPLAICFAFSILTSQPARAQTLTVLTVFGDGPDGIAPAAGLTIDNAGILYGTTSGYFGVQTSAVDELKNVGGGWLLNPLYTFYPNNQTYGYGLYSKVVLGPDGSLYGSATTGGIENCVNGSGCGTIFKLRPPPTFCRSVLCAWNITVLLSFTGDSGWYQVG